MFKTTTNIIMFSILIISNSAHAFITVGDAFNGCAFDNLDAGIQSALDRGFEEIRVTRDYTQGFSGTLTSRMTFKGGYETCADANDDIQGNNKSNWTTGLLGTSVIRIIDNTPPDVPFSIVIDGFNIFGGNNLTNNEAGGIKIVGSGANGFRTYVRIENSNIYDNQGSNGGAMSISGSPIRVDISNTKIYDNEADNGGGIHCKTHAYLNIINNSAINSNRATNGGGIHLSSFCRLDLSSGDTLHKGQMQEGIFDNFAVIGGGIYANRAGIALNGDTNAPASVSNNRAVDNGGGIYVENLSKITAVNTRLDFNSSNEIGGAVMAIDSQFTMARLPEPCWGNDNHCSSLSYNSSSNGGAILTDNTLIDIDSTLLQKNFGEYSLIQAERTGRSYTLTNNVITNNTVLDEALGERGLFRFLFGHVDVDFSYNTVAKNDIDSVFVVKDNNQINLNIANSIIWQPASEILNDINLHNDNAVVTIDCILYGNLNGLQDFAGYNTHFLHSENPQFVNSFGGNYHLDDNSPAIDFCDNFFLPQTKDLDDIARGNDSLNIQNFIGIYDLGAYEH